VDYQVDLEVEFAGVAGVRSTPNRGTQIMPVSDSVTIQRIWDYPLTFSSIPTEASSPFTTAVTPTINGRSTSCWTSTAHSAERNRCDRQRVGIGCAVAVVLAACGSQSASAPSVTPTTTSALTASQAPAKPVPAQLQFTATTIDGQQFSGESMLGKPAVLWFWAPWCPVCQSEAPMVGRIATANPGVTFVGVAALDQVPAMREFVDKYPVKGWSSRAATRWPQRSSSADCSRACGTCPG
jgi:thiol-disulfide isomerase/thioredoxin